MAYTFKHGDRPLDRLTIQRAVGRGGFGEVYYAVYDSGKQVAAKYLRENPEVELRGISQVMNLKSPHLITIYDVQHNTENEPFVIMEYVSGPSLRELLTAEPDGMGPQKAAFFLQGIASGLSYLHDRGIVHRDLKPGNIFYDDGYVKIGDYGLSKHIAMSAHSGNTVSVGTVHYMAPEIGSGSYSKAIDIYAMGVILYELLTGRLPYTGSSMGEILMRHMNDRPDLVGVPEPFRSVIAKALDKDPAKRYQDVNEMVDAITSVQEVSDSIASFNPASLAGAARYPDATDAAKTQTSPGRGAARPVPPLDARADGFPPIPPIPGMPGEDAPRGRVRQPNAAAAPRSGKCKRSPQFVMIAIVAVTVSMLIGLTAGRDFPDSGFSLAFMLGGAIVGTLLAHFKLIQHLPIRNAVMERIVYASAGTACMLPGIGIAADNVSGDFVGIFVALSAVLLVFDWNARIERGRERRFETGRIFMPALVALIAGSIATDGDFPLQSAAIGAALAMLLPTSAAIFGYGHTPQPDEQLLQRAAAYDRPVSPPPPARRGPLHRDAADASRPLPPAPPPFADPPRTAAQPQQLSAAQPSFVGRATNAGLAFMAKTLIVIGFIWALGFQFQVEVPGGVVGLSQVHIQEGKHQVADFNVPRFVVMIPFALGLFLLVTARRTDGVWHFLRGIVGCGLGMLAAGVAIGPAAEPLGLIFQDKLDSLNQMHNGPLVGLAFLTVIAVTLIFWPKKSARRTIVI